MPDLHAVLATPLSGPLGGLGREGAAALEVWADGAADLPPPWRTVVLDVVDAHPDPAEALHWAEGARPHLVFGPFGVDAGVAAAGATGRLVWNHGAATARLARPGFSRIVNVVAPARSWLAAAVDAVRPVDETATTVALLHAATAMADEVAEGARAAAGDFALAVTAATFPPGEVDEAAARLPDADLLVVAGSPADELDAARALLERPYRAAAFVNAALDEALAPIGAGRDGVLGPVPWLASAAPEPDEGPDARWFAGAYQRRTGEPPTYAAVQAFAAGVVAARCLRDADEADDDALLVAAGSLRCRTLYGDFALDPDTGLQAGHRVLVVQWQQGEPVVVWPEAQAQRAVVHPRPGWE